MVHAVSTPHAYAPDLCTTSTSSPLVPLKSTSRQSDRLQLETLPRSSSLTLFSPPDLRKQSGERLTGNDFDCIFVELKRKGYHTISPWYESPHVSFPDEIVLLSRFYRVTAGSMTFILINPSYLDETHHILNAGDQFEVFPNQIIAVHVGPEGCRFIVAE